MSEHYDDGYNRLIDTVSNSNFSQEDIKRVERAYSLAAEAHKDQKRRSGEPYIIHPVAVAQILAEMGMDVDSICAALLHDVVEDTQYTSRQIRDMFGETVELLVDGVTKLGQISVGASREEQQNENLRKMFIAMSKDPRVIVIKLADRVHNMRTLRFMPEKKRLDKAKETLEIYAPIAHRLGIRAFKEELEDLAISYIDPVVYKEIASMLEAQVESGQDFLEKIKSEISQRVTRDVPNAYVTGRIKSVHGIFKKMYMQGKSFGEVYDIYAARIIVDTVFECYSCLGIIHDMYNPIPGRFKDYISTPKPNMYRSLHTTVIGKDGIPFEVQIRTWEMHQTAEYGIAAHWKYKLGISSSGKFDEQLSWIRQILDAQNDSDDVAEIVNAIKTDFTADEVFAFTPKGDIISLPTGSTVIDFAYAIHSAIGSKMIGAKIGGRITTLDHEINNGEIIEILTSSNPKGPSRDWLSIAKTSSAKSKIRSWFKKERREENIEVGKTEFERELRKMNVHLTDEQTTLLLERLAQRQKLAGIDELYAAVGYGGLFISRLVPKIREEYLKIVKDSAASDEIVEEKPEIKKFTKSPEGIIVEGIDNCLVKFARCCDPLPGDDIIGFITRGHGVSIHNRHCTNVPSDLSRCAEPERWIKCRWDNKTESSYRATLAITGLDRVGFLADISGQLANMRLMIHSLFTNDSKDGRVLLMLTITVNSAEHLSSVKEKLKKIKGVLSVERSNR